MQLLDPYFYGFDRQGCTCDNRKSKVSVLVEYWRTSGNFVGHNFSDIQKQRTRASSANSMVLTECY